ncbi:macro domain-containing protein [Dickeya fangzhongdai]|uniref:macro domain-containing protein n=1 Tax=Dickeya fangzhongdai TaxID=1778540 RepID=UPI000675C6F6|nr:macro domain-containing protein [Dickeya fangzhongdai]
MKVKFYDKKLIKSFYGVVSILSTLFSVLLVFYTMNEIEKKLSFFFLVISLVVVYLILWWHFNKIKKIDLSIDNSKLIVTEGDIFKQNGLKAIAFNEYFDTVVDNKIISDSSLNGIYIKKFITDVKKLDEYIDNYDFSQDSECGYNQDRKVGKKKKFSIGTICLYDDEYILTAFSRFDENNRAYLSMADYLTFLIRFWDQVNIVYAQRSVSVPVFGSGITRIKGHSYISDEDLLKIMIWTFKISEMKFKHPAQLRIIISKSNIDKINLFDVKGTKNGL